MATLPIRPGSGSTRVVYLHVGLPKTGTTFLQAMLHANRDQLRLAGCYYLPSRTSAHHDEARDLRHARPRGYLHPKVPGAWNRLAQNLHEWDGQGVAVASSELLAFANRVDAERAIASLQPAEVHLIITLRDLVRQIPAVWQERVKNGQTMTYERYVNLVEHDDGHSPREFWEGQDPASLIERWGSDLPSDRVHLVTVPPRGSDPDVLWQRFTDVLGVDGSKCQPVRSGANTSLGMAETEVVRRLNEHVQDVPWPFYSRYIKFGIAQGVLAGSSEGARLVLPESMLPWAERRTKQMIASVDGRGYDVAGDLDDLLPPVDGVATGDIPEPDPRILSQAATAAAAYLVREFAKSWQRQSRQERSQQAARGHHWAPAWRRGRDRARLVGLNQIVGLLRRAHRVVRDRVRR